MIPLNPFQGSKELQKDTKLALRNLFKKEINPSFLIKIYYRVKEELKNDLYKYYKLPTFSVENALSGDNDNIDYDICRIIIGIHKSNIIFLDESERKKNEDNTNYEKKLVTDVITHIKLRQYGSCFFRQHQIINGDRFLYFSLPYDLFTICIKMNVLLTITDQSKVPFYSIFSKISNMGLSALSLLEDNFLDTIYPICRGIIELFTTYLCISKNKNAMKKYEYLTKIETEYSQCGQTLPEKFYDMFENRIKKSSYNEPPHQFLHFGWVDELKDYHKIVERNAYTINGLIKYLKSINNDKNFEMYNDFYQKCNHYTHANINVSKYPLLSYFEVSIMLYITITYAYQNLCKLLDVDTNIDDIDILTKARTDYELLIQQYNNRTTESFNKYYKNLLF